jgi:hypothetical protein
MPDLSAKPGGSFSFAAALMSQSSVSGGALISESAGALPVRAESEFGAP